MENGEWWIEIEEEWDRTKVAACEALEAAWRELPERGWETYEGSYSFGAGSDGARRPVEIQAIPYCRQADGVLLLDLRACYVDTGRSHYDSVWFLGVRGPNSTYLPTEYFGRARMVVPLPGGVDDIPTPREAMRLMEGQ